MSMLIRSGTIVVVLGLMGGIASTVRPGWTSECGIDFWNQSALEQQMADDATQMAELEARDAAVLQRIAVKELIVKQLVKGTMSLPEAAARFHKLNAAVPTYMDIIRLTYAGMSDDEAVCRNVIAFVEAYLAQSTASHREPIIARLHAEMHAFLSSGTALASVETQS